MSAASSALCMLLINTAVCAQYAGAPAPGGCLSTLGAAGARPFVADGGAAAPDCRGLEDCWTSLALNQLIFFFTNMTVVYYGAPARAPAPAQRRIFSAPGKSPSAPALARALAPWPVAPHSARCRRGAAGGASTSQRQLSLSRPPHTRAHPPLDRRRLSRPAVERAARRRFVRSLGAPGARADILTTSSHLHALVILEVGGALLLGAHRAVFGQ